MNQTEDQGAKKVAGKLTLLCALIYFASYVSRYSLTTSIAEIVSEGILTKEQIGLAPTALFVCYAVGQIISGLVADKLKPEYVVCVGLFGGTAANLILPAVVSNPYTAAVVWGFNGLCQAMYWPPIVKMLAEYLPKQYYTHAVFKVIIAAHCGNIINYLLGSLCIKTLDSWKAIFMLAAGISVAGAAVWLLGFSRLKKTAGLGIDAAKKENLPSAVGDSADLKKAIVASGAFLFLIGIALQGAVKEAVTTWLPNFATTYFKLDPSDAILQSVSIPVVSIICLLVMDKLYAKLFHDEATSSAVMFGFGALMAGVIVLVPGLPSIVAIVCGALLIGSMHGVNLFLINYLPGRFASYNRSSTVSGVTNAFTYVGSSVFTYGCGWMNDRTMMYSWILIPLLGLVSCLIVLPKWKKYTGRTK